MGLWRKRKMQIKEQLGPNQGVEIAEMIEIKWIF